VQNETAKQIVQGSEQLGSMINTLFAWKSENWPKSIGAMRKKIAADNEQFSVDGWESMCEAFRSARLRKRALSYMCMHDTLSPNEAIAIVQVEIMRAHIKGDDIELSLA
jgi:hypothetical protein